MYDKNTHFKAVFGYVVGISIAILLYVVAVTFLPVPEKNARFVDIAFGFLLNVFGSASAYLIGGNPNPAKRNDMDTGITLPPGEKTTVTTETKTNELG